MGSRRYEVIRTYSKLNRVDQQFYDLDDMELILINPVVTEELNANGSFEFSMPKGHKFYNDIHPLIDEFMVRDTYRDHTLFVGRPMSVKETDFKTVEVYCEGAMGYLHDILQRPKSWIYTTPHNFFRDLINRYNDIKGARIPHQKIDLGSCTMRDRQIYRYSNYDDTYELLKKGCLDSDGGYLLMTYDRVGGKTINWLSDETLPTTDQTIGYGKNIVTFEESYDLSDSATAIIPLGADTADDLPDNLGKRKVGIPEEVEPIVGSVVASEYWRDNGYVEKVMEYPDADNPSALRLQLHDDPAFYNHTSWRALSITSSIIDKMFSDSVAYPPTSNPNEPIVVPPITPIPDGPTTDRSRMFRLGYKVQMDSSTIRYSLYDWFYKDLRVTKIVTRLESAVIDVSVGNLPKRNLTDQYKRRTDETQSKTPTSKSDRSSGGSDGNSAIAYGPFMLTFPELDVVEPITGKIEIIKET